MALDSTTRRTSPTNNSNNRVLFLLIKDILEFKMATPSSSSRAFITANEWVITNSTAEICVHSLDSSSLDVIKRPQVGLVHTTGVSITLKSTGKLLRSHLDFPSFEFIGAGE